MSLLDKLPFFARGQKFLISASGELAGSDDKNFEKTVKEQILVRVHPQDLSKAQLISSELGEPGIIHADETYHKPMIDIDFEAALLPSSTPGHYHLYLDKDLSWEEYKKLLDVFAEVGIIGKGYHKAALHRKATTLRLPWVKKGEDSLKSLTKPKVEKPSEPPF